MKRIYAIAKGLVDESMTDALFVEMAEDAGFVWSTPMSFCESYNKDEDGTQPGKYAFRIVDVNPVVEDDSSFGHPVYLIREEYYGGAVVVENPERIRQDGGGLRCDDIASMLDHLSNPTAYGVGLTIPWYKLVMAERMTYEEFCKLLQGQIDGAERVKESPDNVLDLRAFKAPYDLWKNQGIYCISEIQDAWEFVKDSDEWFIDIYENFRDAGYSEFTDFAICFNL